jgi:two-component system sensor histidine kinase/response regulator
MILSYINGLNLIFVRIKKTNVLSLRSKLYAFWVRLTGDPLKFQLNARIFHSVCLISFAGLAYNVPFNYFIGLPKIAAASFVAMIIEGCFYYFSRFANKTRICIFLSNFVGLGLFTLNYFLNSGISGPTSLFFLLFLLLSVAVNPVSQYKIWIAVNIGIVIALHLTEFLYPELVPNTYQNRTSRFVDEISAYVVIAMITYFCIDYILTSYEKEKKSAFEKSRSIEEKNQQIIRQNEELEKLNGEKNKLMSIVAHDLRSPLANIQNYLELLSTFDLDEQQRIEIKKDLLNATKDTQTMLTKLLAWSKSQSLGVVAYREYWNLNELLENTLYADKITAARKGITMDYYLDPSLKIYADRDMMQLVIRNFVGNAIKFTPSGGEILVRAERDDTNCIISIKDTGIGIAYDRQDALFSLDAKSTYGTQGEKGVGLGLLLCMEYISAQNGKIWFESEPEKGTCFYIAVPVDKS